MTLRSFAFTAAACLCLSGAIAVPALAADRGTMEEATAMAKRAAALIKSDGAEKAYAAFNSKDPRFFDRDLYVLVSDYNGVAVAHGANPAVIGKNFITNTDADGKLFVKERIDLAKLGKDFTQDYKYKNPQTGAIEPKSSYCVPLTEQVVCVGIYK